MNLANKTTLSISIVALAIATLACSLAGRLITGGDQGLNRTSELWSDVPKMDGLAASDMEMPLPMKIVLRTMLNNLWRFDDEGEDKTPATGDWIVFATSSTPMDVENFYTNERMTSFGNWEASKEKTCLDGKEYNVGGVLCVFQKTANNKNIGLAIIAGQEEGTKQTHVFFLRVEKPSTGENINKPRKTSVSQTPQGSITKLNGTAPYGIESRPLPAGTDLEQLLLKQVGPYTRVSLERSQERGTTATSIDIDGNGVYATYQNGERELFVEFSVASSPEIAQSSWDVVVGDANDGIYPRDPQFGSFRTEPSYLKVVNENGAFFAWTRGPYFFSVSAKSGEADLAAFMSSFPY